MRRETNLPAPDLLLTNATVLTMDNHQVLHNCDVAVGQGVIVDVGDRLSEKYASYRNRESFQTIDCSGKCVMPGLVDSHVHFDEDYMGGLFLAAGVTTVRNMRGYQTHKARMERIAKGELTGPFMVSTGPIADGEDPEIPENDNWIIHSEEEAEEVIAYTKAQGFRFMKTYPSILPKLYRYLMRRCADEDLPVFGHMTKTISHEELADLGYYCVEHSSSLPRSLDAITYCAKAGMWYCPTQLVCETLPDYVWKGKQLQDLPYWGVLPKAVQQEWLRKNQVIAHSYRRQGIRPDIQVIIDRGRAFLEHSHRVLAGSDCAYPGIIPGFALWTELEKLVSLYGMTAEEALLAATVRPALCMKLSGRKGRVVPGLDADLIVLSENPLTDIRHIETLQWVITQGRVYHRQALDELIVQASNWKGETT